MCVFHPINLLWLQLPSLSEHSSFFLYIHTQTKPSCGLAVKKRDSHYWLCIRFVYKRQGILIIDIYTRRSMQQCRKCIHSRKAGCQADQEVLWIDALASLSSRKLNKILLQHRQKTQINPAHFWLPKGHFKTGFFSSGLPICLHYCDSQ